MLYNIKVQQIVKPEQINTLDLEEMNHESFEF